MSKLIITDTVDTAINIAAALGQIRAQKKKLFFDDIFGNSKKVVDNRNFLKSKVSEKQWNYFNSNFESEKLFVTWLGQNPIKESKETADIIENEKIELNEDVYKRINRQEYWDEGRVESVIFALLNTEENIKAVVRIMQVLPCDKFFTINVNQCTKEAIEDSYLDRVPVSISNINEATARYINKRNSEKFITEKLAEKGLDYELNMYDLAALYLIGDRERKHKEHQVKYQIHVSLNIGGSPQQAAADEWYEESEAAEILEKLPDKFKAKGLVRNEMLTTPDVFNFDQIGSIKNIKEHLLSLYERGYISRPYTLEKEIPQKIHNHRISKDIIEACKKNGSEELSSPEDQKRILDNARTEVGTGALVPFEGMGRLSDEEALIYRGITDGIFRSINAQEKIERYLFDSGVIPFYANAKGRHGSLIRESLTIDKSIAASCSKVPHRHNAKFECYKVFEVFKTLERMHLADAEIYCNVFEKLQNYELVIIDDNGVIKVSPKGYKVINALKPGKNFLEACRSIEQSIEGPQRKGLYRENINKIIEGLSDDAKTFKKSPEKANSDKEIKENKQTVNPLRDFVRKEDKEPAGKCLKCDGYLFDEGEDYSCSKCGSKYPKTFEYDGYITTINQKDLLNLKKVGRTSFKIPEMISGEENTDVAFFITNENGSLGITNESMSKCPICGKPLYVLKWGFMCFNQPDCNFSAPFELFGRRIPNKEYKHLLQNEETGIIDDLITPDGEIVSGKIKPIGENKFTIIRKQQI